VSGNGQGGADNGYNCIRISASSANLADLVLSPREITARAKRDLIAAGLCLGAGQNKRRLGRARALGEGMQQAENAGVGQGDAEDNGSGDGKGDDKSDQQTPQVWPTFPSYPAAAINGLHSVSPSL
jgi:hypothetical protein